MRRILPSLATVAALLLPVAASAQTRVITGTVTVSGTTQPLPSANITVVGSTAATRTEANGQYRLVTPAGDVTLIVRALGHIRQTRVVPAGQSTVDFALEPDALRLESVVVTGQATTVDRRSATTAVAYVSGDEMANVPAPTIENALAGRITGVNLQSNSGAPGGGIQMQIRGNNTILGAYDPLYVIDGVIYSNATVASGRGTISSAAFATAEDDAVNRVADINPADIASIEILKSAAASSIYGSKAANGVVIITTKRGQAGQTNVSVTQRFGQFSPTKTLGSRRFTESEAVGIYGPGVAHWFDNNPSPYFNHFDQVYTNSNLSWETDASVNGGNDRTRYFLGATGKHDGGIERNTGFDRQNLRVNVDQNLAQNLTLRVSSTYNRSTNDRGWNNNCNNFACHGYAFAYTPSFVDYRARDANGNYLTPDWGIQVNPLQTTDLAKNHEETNRFTGGLTLNYDAVSTTHQTLNFVVGGGLDVFNQGNSLWSPNELFFEQPQTLPGAAIAGNGNSKFYNWNANAVHAYTTSAWSLHTSGGLQYEDRQLLTSRITTTNLVPGQRNVGQGTNTVGTENLTQERTFALYGQEELRLLSERLLVQAGLRAERSSVNGDISTYNVFPKFSASYRLLGLIGDGSEIKPRIAYGETGNLPTFGQKFTLLGTPQLGGATGFTVAGASGFAGVQPERVKELEIGVDGIALDSRLAWELTGFQRATTNLLLQRVPAPSTGFTSQVFNGGKIANQGIEAMVGVTPIQRRNLQWLVRTTYTRYTSEVKNLAGLPPFRPPLSGFGGLGVTFIQEGHPITQIVGRAFDASGNRTPTDVQIGNTAPDYRMGLVSDLTYKNTTLNLVLDYQHGGDIINLTQFLYDDSGLAADYGSSAWEYRMKGYNGGVMTPYIEDATFLKVREISLRTTLPNAWTHLAGLGARSISVGVSGRNLFTFQRYSGLDPEVANLGSAAIRNNLDVASYPPNRSIFFDIAVRF
ncbi:MAG TPA: SusC/RagA family TonB-linked outer membrane protein [Gemmatimonadaceae bacterium]|nr:SusC/RagA family TonB-linked outer membrane protein [Gemmatimonadaceae bacterium]